MTAAACPLQVLSEPWRLSTSQTTQFQIRMFDPNKYPNHLAPGGGFGPVSTCGRGWVSRTGPGAAGGECRASGQARGGSTALALPCVEAERVASSLADGRLGPTGAATPRGSRSASAPRAASP